MREESEQENTNGLLKFCHNRRYDENVTQESGAHKIILC
jgi:hypothetical protein